MSRELQSNMYYILEETAKVLDKENLNYFLTYGTMLGAVRHHGYIPWDDDTDISVKREDYDEVIDVLTKQLDPEVFFVQNYHTDKNFPHTFTRVCLKNTIAKQRFWKDLDMQHLIFIDIFPLDVLPANTEILFAKSKKINTIFMLKMLKAKQFGKDEATNTSGKIKYAIKRLLSLPLAFISMRKLNKQQEKLQINDSDPTDEYINLYTAVTSIDETLVSKKDFDDLILVPFEKTNFKIPRRYDELLTRTYGDYNELPSEEHRRGNHDFIELVIDERTSNLLD